MAQVHRAIWPAAHLSGGRLALLTNANGVTERPHCFSVDYSELITSAQLAVMKANVWQLLFLDNM